ncbi:MAG TPA: DUF5698 domain-containing protein [Ignavibacteria bacterium]|nr:DUF5698 domain-containing protein [Ignavibacteria bacterium]HRJ03111.1 DUF5698 domain-containing protein [Ignavibacteria bacterium]HRJ85669.1 DUF5698 domain-containing protein [Ignavibacteria bacterium]
MNILSLGAGMLFIMCARIFDVSLGTLRMLNVVKGNKYKAAVLGFIEVLIWIAAMRYIMQNLDNMWNILGYSAGFALGTIAGVSIENKFGTGYLQVYVISKYYTDAIADKLRSLKFGVTIVPGEGARSGVAVLVLIVLAKRRSEVIKTIEQIDPAAFISVQSVIPYRGFIHSRK